VSVVSNIERHVLVCHKLKLFLKLFEILQPRGTNRANVPEMLGFADISSCVIYSVSHSLPNPALL
jgi:hypothetical protein